MHKKGIGIGVIALGISIAVFVVAMYFVYVLYDSDIVEETGNNVSFECYDKVDNDGDGLVDLNDSGCQGGEDNDESDCGDGICEGGEDLDLCGADCVVQNVSESHTICADDSCVIADGAGEDECSADSDCGLGLPDLVVSNISMEVTDEDTNETTNVTKYEVTVYVVVKNVGDLGAVQSATRVSFAGDSYSLSSANLLTSALKSGEEETLKSVYEDLDKGRYDATAYADNSFKVDEKNEENNGHALVVLRVPS